MSDVFIGRQPLLDRSGNTVGYELLYRSAATSQQALVLDGDAASARVMLNATTEFGLDRLVGDKLAFFNLTTSYLVDPSLLSHLPAERVVLEVLEDVEACAGVIDGLTHLREMGYRIALDDFVDHGPSAGLLDLADIVKYDFSQVRGPDLVARIAADHRAGRTVVVERVETRADYSEAFDAGADLFQGYYFARPTTMTGRAIPPNTLALVDLLARINQPAATMPEIVAVLRHDVSMSLKVLRYVNTAAFAPSAEIDSVQAAAVLVGRSRLRGWTALALLSSIDDKPTELVNMALTRAKFCELIAIERRLDMPESFYTVGMLSLLDVMTDTPMKVITSQIAISDEIRSALIGDDTELGRVLRQAIELENAIASRSPHTGDVDSLRCHQLAMTWATEVVSLSET